MDEIYSLALLMSLVAGTIAVLIAILERIGWVRISVMSWVVPASIVAWAGLLVSFVVHLVWGHTPGGPDALAPMAFVSEHPSFVPAAILPGVAWSLRGRSPGQESVS